MPKAKDVIVDKTFDTLCSNTNSTLALEDYASVLVLSLVGLSSFASVDT